MNSFVSIIMYHYVRDLAHSQFPEIKGMTVDQFRGQIKYIKKFYNVISADFLLDAVEAKEPLPPRALMLTFDDGFSDHYNYVFPVLQEEHISGIFFPPGKFINENKVLDVNKIHFILAATADKSKLVDLIDKTIIENQTELKPQEKYWQEFARPSRFDPAEIIYIKRMLQRGFPGHLRSQVVDELFRKFVTADEVAFSKDLYLRKDQISEMRQQGMQFGSHGYDHYWLDSLTREEQEIEIDKSLEFLKSVGVNTRQWIMCYPHGAYNDSLLKVIQERNCIVGLGTEVGIANLNGKGGLLALKRLNTNDLPVDAAAPACHWTKLVMKDK